MLTSTIPFRYYTFTVLIEAPDPSQGIMTSGVLSSGLPGFM